VRGLDTALYIDNIYSIVNSTDPKAAWLPAISPAAPGALYAQIVEGLKREIGEGRLAPGTPLPSFRKLAEDLLVSVITVKRAYEELERAGIIYRRQGLGTFVAENGGDRSRQVKRERARELFSQAVREAAEAGLSQQDILKLAQEILNQPGA
jgi:GntR family transcriptional regulator